MRYFFHISYHGQYFNGWQRHPKARSIQEVIEQALSGRFKTPIPIVGCGRTDAHVHASQFFFHADLPHWDFDLLFRLNKALPYNISVFDITPVGEKQHARFDAVQRAYDYFIHTYKDPFLSHLSAHYILKLEGKKMSQAVRLLPKYNDYRAFCASPDKYDHTICHVSAARLYVNPTGDRFRFQISSNRFLSKMIRMIVGKLLLVGTDQLSLNEFEAYLSGEKTPPFIKPAHPTGLFLSKVTYPFLDLPARTGLWEHADWIPYD